MADKIVLCDTKSDLITQFKAKFPYTYTGKLKEYMKSEIEREDKKEDKSQFGMPDF